MKDLTISKELIKAVLEKETKTLSKDFNFTINEDYIEFSDDGEMQFEYCIYKFAFKCKEWAYKQKFTILTEFVNQDGVFSYVIDNNQSIENYGYLVGDIKILLYIPHNKTEIEAIIKACEWILSEVNK